MTSLMRAALCLVLLLSFAGTSPGQRNNKSGSKRKGEHTQAPDFSEVIPSDAKEPPPHKKVGSADVDYLRDGTIVATVSLEDVYRQKGNVLSLGATIDSPGPRLTKPSAVFFAVYVPAKFPALGGTPALDITFDDGRHFSGATRRRTNANGEGTDGLFTDIDYDSFKRMSDSKRVTVRLGKVEFALDAGQLKAFRDLLSAVEQ